MSFPYKKPDITGEDSKVLITFLDIEAILISNNNICLNREINKNGVIIKKLVIIVICCTLLCRLG